MRVGTRGQVAIPLPLREKMGIVPGTEVEFRKEGGRLNIQKTATGGHAILDWENLTRGSDGSQVERPKWAP